MSDAAGFSVSQLGEVVSVVGPVAAGVWVLFKTVGSIVAAAVEKESLQRHEMGKRMTQNVATLEARTAVLERDGATRKDLDNAEARIKSDFQEVKSDVRELRTTAQGILEKVAAMGSTLAARPAL